MKVESVGHSLFTQNTRIFVVRDTPHFTRIQCAFQNVDCILIIPDIAIVKHQYILRIRIFVQQNKQADSTHRTFDSLKTDLALCNMIKHASTFHLQCHTVTLADTGRASYDHSTYITADTCF